MKYKVKYEDGDHRKSLIDMLQYVGMRRYKILAREAARRSEDQIHILCGITGVGGRPVHDLIKRYKK